jgi:hypothetical protein
VVRKSPHFFLRVGLSEGPGTSVTVIVDSERAADKIPVPKLCKIFWQGCCLDGKAVYKIQGPGKAFAAKLNS